MAIEYTNRKGGVYYLHEGKTKTGKPKYHFSKKKDGVLARLIPEGYEVYENPNAQVFLRKITPKLVTDNEIAVVDNGVERYAELEHFIVDVKKNRIVVYLPDQDLDALQDLASHWGQAVTERMKDFWIRSKTYSPMMQFVLTDKASREFAVHRWCFRGSVDGWIRLDSSTDLASLVAKYCPHLGKESFFELMGYPTEMR